MNRGQKPLVGQPQKVSDLSAYRRKLMTLDAFDRMQRDEDRERREKRAEVERKGRESL